MKSKKIIIITFAILYGLLSFLLFSDTFFIHLIEVQKAYYLKKSDKFENITFSLQYWQKLENKKEFKLHGHYYDVKRIKIDKDKITATVIRDDYENLLKYVSKNILPENTKQKGVKNKRFFPACIFSTASITIMLQKKESTFHFFYNSTYSELLLRRLYRPPRKLEF